MEEFHVTCCDFELPGKKEFLGVSFLATWFCGMRHSPLFPFQAGWSEALMEKILTIEADPAFVMLHSQEVTVFPGPKDRYLVIHTWYYEHSDFAHKH